MTITASTKGSALIRVEIKRDDEQPHPRADAAAPLGIARKPNGQGASPDAMRKLAKLPRRSAYIPRKLACDPRFEPHNRRRVEYTRGRRDEHVTAWGGVSRAVGAMISTAGWLFAASEFAAELGAESGDVALFAMAARLAGEAKLQEHSAWEMNAREAATRSRNTGPVDPMAAIHARLEKTT